jgi:hypothetical protein
MAALQTHHEDGRDNGHDPDRMLTLCWFHHRKRHEGLLRIEGTAPDFRFVLLDGTVLGEATPKTPFSRENTTETPFSRENTTETLDAGAR